MKKMKRLVAVLLAGIMALAMFTACSGGGSAMPTDDVKKAEALYMDIYNAVLNADYENDAELKTKTKQILDDSLNADGTLKSGKEITVTLPSDNLFASTAITILVQPGSNNVPYGMTSEQLTTAYNNRQEALAEVRKTIGTSADTLKAATTRFAVGAVKKGDKTYIAIAMTMDLSKLL